MARYEVRLEGVTPLMHHKMTEEALFALLGSKVKKNKDAEILTPREIAEKAAYKTEKGEFYLPSENINRAFRDASSDYKQTKSQKSMKSLAAGIFRCETMINILVDDKNKPLKNFEVQVSKATNHQRGAVAVCRPRFDRWATEFTVQVNEELCSPDVVQRILQDAGIRYGIGAYRVNKGGPYGSFNVTKWKKIDE